MRKSKDAAARSQNELIRELAEKLGCTLAQAKRNLHSVAELIADDLRIYGVINLPQIGRFTRASTPGFIGEEPQNRGIRSGPERVRLLFNPKKNWRDKFGKRRPNQFLALE